MAALDRLLPDARIVHTAIIWQEVDLLSDNWQVADLVDDQQPVGLDSLGAADQRLVADELHVAGLAEAQGGAEGVQRRAALAELDPVDPQLFVHRRREAHHRVGRRRLGVASALMR